MLRLPFKIRRDIIKYYRYFFCSFFLFLKKKQKTKTPTGYSPFFSMCLASRVENRCFKSVSCHISPVLGFFYISFDSYLEYWNWNTHVYWVWALNITGNDLDSVLGSPGSPLLHVIYRLDDYGFISICQENRWASLGFSSCILSLFHSLLFIPFSQLEQFFPLNRCAINIWLETWMTKCKWGKQCT